MSGFTLGEYFDAEKPDFSLTDEQLEEVRMAMQALKNVCVKHNVPMVGVVCVGSEGDKFDTRMSTLLDVQRTPIEMLLMRHINIEGLADGILLGVELLNSFGATKQ